MKNTNSTKENSYTKHWTFNEKLFIVDGNTNIIFAPKSFGLRVENAHTNKNHRYALFGDIKIFWAKRNKQDSTVVPI